MPKIAYVPKKFRADALGIIAKANEIIAEYQPHGLDLTLRQLYYQFVQRGLMPNTQKSYDKLGAIISSARMAGMIDWDAIVDRTRKLKDNSHWGGPASILSAAARSYATDKWADQEYRVEVWIEKEALAGVLEATCPQLDVDYFSCRGYVSQSAQWRAAQRFERYIAAGQKPVVIHLGDHDPSGIDMTRDNDDRLFTFGSPALVRRIALNMDQIEELKPPPNPAKMTDSRADDYVLKFGTKSWELDALNPTYLQRIITDAVLLFRDDDKWGAALAAQEEERKLLVAVSENYGKVKQLLK